MIAVPERTASAVRSFCHGMSADDRRQFQDLVNRDHTLRTDLSTAPERRVRVHQVDETGRPNVWAGYPDVVVLPRVIRTDLEGAPVMTGLGHKGIGRETAASLNSSFML